MSGWLDTNIFSIDPRLIQIGGPLEPLYQIGFALPGAPPDGLTTATSSSALFDYESSSPAQPAVYAANQVNSYFAHNSNYRWDRVGQARQPPRGPQGQRPYWPNTSSFVSPHLPPRYQPTHHNEEGRTVADHRGLGRYVCTCRKAFKRQADLHRHLESSKRHNKDPRGPACPVDHCSHPAKFSRADNFKAHYMKQHGASSDEADAYIREWKNRGSP